MMSIVTGASGHVGANLVRALLERGEDVRALVHVDASALSGLGVELARGDVCDLESLRAAFDGADVVYHLAGHISVAGGSAPRLADVNVSGTRNVLRACLDCHVRRLVHFSSIHALSEPPSGVAADESTPLVPASGPPTYDRSKADGERLVREAVSGGLDAVIVAPTAVVGPYDFRPSYFGRVLLQLARGTLPIVVRGGFDWVDAGDVAAGAVAAAQRSQGGSKYILSGHWRSVIDVARLVCEACGGAAPVSAAPASLARACGRLGEAVCRLTGREAVFTAYAVEALSRFPLVSHERATRELGYMPRPFEQTVVDTCRWFIENGCLGNRRSAAT